MVKYLVEIGLGARRCPPDRIEWYYEPCVRLVRLHHRFRHTEAEGGGSAAKEAVSDSSRRLSVGAAAGAIRVCEAILAAQERIGPAQTRYFRLERMTRVLGGMHEAGDAVLDLDQNCRDDAQRLARAEAGPLASNDHREIHPADPDRLRSILDALEKQGSSDSAPATS